MTELELEEMLLIAKKTGRINPKEKHLQKEASLKFLKEVFKSDHCSRCWINLVKRLQNHLDKQKKDEEFKKTMVREQNVEIVENIEETTNTNENENPMDEIIEIVTNLDEKPKKKKKKIE